MNSLLNLKEKLSLLESSISKSEAEEIRVQENKKKYKSNIKQKLILLKEISCKKNYNVNTRNETYIVNELTIDNCFYNNILKEEIHSSQKTLTQEDTIYLDFDSKCFEIIHKLMIFFNKNNDDLTKDNSIRYNLYLTESFKKLLLLELKCFFIDYEEVIKRINFM